MSKPRTTMIGAMLAQMVLDDIELAYQQLCEVDGPEVSYVRRLLSRLGQRIREGIEPPRPRIAPAATVDPTLMAPWEGPRRF